MTEESSEFHKRLKLTALWARGLDVHFPIPLPPIEEEIKTADEGYNFF
jgi:hypothetical protein